MKHFNVYAMTAVLLLSLPVIAQKRDNGQNHPAFKRLYIGDTVLMDSIFFTNVRNYSDGRARLSDFKGKYIILDFWNKGCTACIAAFPHMEQLQKQFKDDIQVLLVTENTEKELALLFKNSPNLKGTTLPIIMGEKVLSRELFPRISSPYHVWLDRDGKVVASTNSSESNYQNLQKLILGKSLDLIVRYDIIDDDLTKDADNQKISLLKFNNGFFLKHLKYFAQIPQVKTGNNLPEPNGIPNLLYYSTFMSGAPDFGNTVGSNSLELIEESGKPKGLRLFNRNLKELFSISYGANFVKVIPEGNAKGLYDGITDSTDRMRHQLRTTYCYESSMPNYSLEGAQKLLQQDLIRFFGMRGDVEERMIKHLILIRLGTPAEKKLQMKEGYLDDGNYKEGEEKEGYVIKNKPFTQVIPTKMKTTNRAPDDPIIIDDTGFDKGAYKPITVNGRLLFKNLIDIKLKLKRTDFHATEANIPLLRRELEKYGVGLKEEMRKVKVLVLKSAL